MWQLFVGADVDGYFGVMTRAATQSVQARLALHPDGIVGPKTWERAMRCPD